MLKEKQLLQEYESMYYEKIKEDEETPPEQLETFEIEFMKEKQENQKYDIQEKKGHKKTKKISGGN